MALDEKAIVVDENDKVIEYKFRGDLTKKDRIRITVIWIEDGEGNALIHKRSKNKSSWPGYWENAAGGGVAHNESYEENAYKELEEEIGVKGIPLVFITKTLIKTSTGERYCSWFKAVLDWPLEKFTLESSEVEEVKWVNKEELFNHRDANPEVYMPSSAYWRELFS
jgi:isopentenyldiphosphate isomerase